MAKLTLQLVTPEKTVLNKELDSLSCPTTLGQITILPHHIPLVATLAPGELIAKSSGKEHIIAVAGGFVEVRDKGEVIILADAAEHHYEIDSKQAEEAVARAKQDIAKMSAASEEYAKVSAVLEKNLSRLNIARKHAHRKSSFVDKSTLEQ